MGAEGPVLDSAIEATSARRRLRFSSARECLASGEAGACGPANLRASVRPRGAYFRQVSKRRSLFFAFGALAALVLVLVVALPFALTHRQDLPLERFYGDAAVSIVSRILGGDAPNPLASDQRALVTGRAAYTGSCAICHGAKGDGRGAFGTTTYPDATDFTSDAAKSKTDAQLFWIVKNGLGFTAMPAFGGQYKDAEIWAMVAYIRALQRGTASALSIPDPSLAQLAAADLSVSRQTRGAAIYFALGCHLCHGPEGDAPGELSIRGRIETEIVRRGDDRGMPAYGKNVISDAELADLETYLLRFAAIPSSPD
jgi:mono/diheme cytochrome c family protein